MDTNQSLTILNFFQSVEKDEALTKVKELYPELHKMLNIEREAFYAAFKDHYEFTSRIIEAFRKDLNNYIPPEKKAEEIKIEISGEDKQKAITYLKNPELIDNIIQDIQFAGNVINETENILLLFLVYTSRILKKPISCVTYAQSSTGKSYLNKKVLQFMPPEKTHKFSSMSKTSLEYLPSEMLNHTAIFIEEIEGAMPVLATIRVVQSEGELNRCVTIPNPKTNKFEAQHEEKDAPCVINYTTTKDSIYDENSTRIFEIYGDESIEQTKQIVKANLQGFNPESIENHTKQDEIINLHHTVQRILKPYEVHIPFWDFLKFPSKSVRHRRDSERFRVLIELITLIRQFQKEIKERKGVQYIEADIADYAYAHNLSKTVFLNAVDRLSARARNLLTVIDDYSEKEEKQFSYKKIMEHAATLHFDFNNIDDVRKQIDSLSKYEYVQLVAGGGKGSTCIFKRTEIGGSGKKNDITENLISPDELKERIRSMSIDKEDTPSHTYEKIEVIA